MALAGRKIAPAHFENKLVIVDKINGQAKRPLITREQWEYDEVRVIRYAETWFNFLP